MKIEEISLGDKHYPEKLKNIKNAPNKIYVIGNKEILNSESIAMIGSRNCSEEGLKNARLFSTNIAKAGFTIISGMAKGIDSASHKGALEVGGKTIAVFGCGVDYIYPRENEKLYQEILEKGGTIVSEYPLGTKPSSENFRQRNRIVSALSLGVLVVEAKYKSGTSITIKYAKQQKKDIFCIPSSIGNKKGLGTNIQIRKGATLVMEPREIIEKYDVKNIKPISIEESDLEKERKLEINTLSKIKEEYRDIYKAIRKGLNVDEISKETEVNLTEIYSKLFMMEMEGIIEKDGNSYITKI